MEELSASLEDYLEAIYHLAGEDGEARTGGIADRLGVAASSATNALHSLARKGLVVHSPYNGISLSEAGRERARGIVSRHETLTDFLANVLGVPRPSAEDCACKMEHAMPDLVLERLIEFMRFECEQQDGRVTWVESKGFMRTPSTPEAR